MRFRNRKLWENDPQKVTIFDFLKQVLKNYQVFVEQIFEIDQQQLHPLSSVLVEEIKTLFDKNLPQFDLKFRIHAVFMQIVYNYWQFLWARRFKVFNDKCTSYAMFFFGENAVF